MTKQLVDNKALWDLYNELNYRFFRNALYIQDIRWGYFIGDYIHGGLTYGMYVTERNPKTLENVYRYLALNRHLLLPSLNAVFPKIIEGVLYHEMCHGLHAITNPENFSLSVALKMEHGGLFQDYMERWPYHKEFNHVIQTFAPVLVNETISYGEKYLKTHPDKYANFQRNMNTYTRVINAMAL